MIRIKNPIAPRLPVEYQEVEYIESTGTQYIDAGLVATPTTKIEVDFQYTAIANAMRLFGITLSAKYSGGLSYDFYVNSASDFAYTYNNNQGNWISTNIKADTERHNLVFNNSKTLTLDSNKMDMTGTATYDSGWNILIFASFQRGSSNNPYNFSKVKIYSFKIYENDTLVRNFVPVIRNSDNVAGLYDLVNDVFYSNAGTGVFLRGNEVNKRDINIKPMLGNKPLIRRYAGDKLVYGREPGSYEQLVNYTMLYDNGNECTDITGGWENSFTQGGGTFTKNLDHLYLYVKGSTWKKCAGTKNKIDMSLFSKIYTRCKASRTSASPGICPWGLTSEFESNLDGNPEQLLRGWILTDSNTFDGFRTLDLSTITSAHVNFKVQSNSSSNATTLYIYDVFMVKEDDWQTLASIAGITASSIDDILSNLSTLLANKEAVDFMIYQCTGSFMASAIQSSTFLTALNSSPYNTIIQANEHWNKFLAMVA